ELLLRMRDERGELVPPDAFIPAAERYNLMPSLDRWVITQVMSSLVYREHRARAPYMLAVNLSGTTLNDSRFLDFLLDELAADAIPPGALCFEITETAAIANLGNVVSFMNALKERGCRFSLDDFGTGLSSLTYLKHLPVDYVKIDGQFIRNVTRDPTDESMVDAIARMARALNIKTIAERVEGRDVLKRLAEIGIAYAQGYYIAVPQPISELPAPPAPDPRKRCLTPFLRTPFCGGVGAAVRRAEVRYAIGMSAHADFAPLIAPDEPPAYAAVSSGRPRAGREVVFVCDHASNRVPAALGRLGLDERHLLDHIAWDIGAASVALKLTEWLGGRGVLGGYSRLVVDLNRSLEDGSAFTPLSDGVLVPGNLGLDAAAKAARAEAIYWPYHDAVARALDEATTDD